MYKLILESVLGKTGGYSTDVECKPYTKAIYYLHVFNVVYLYALALPLVLWYNRKDVQNQIRYAVDRNMAMNYTRIFEALQSHWNSGDVIPQKRMVTVASQLFKKRVSASKQ
ncbi:hypothetical protein NECAME_09586 [Necator americanus]|uniref:Uncharacterized protein n=1 Tax=Necator americanus TaxID=51031 RepID=W2TF88_NECAM|nr:hypothetical protein NECAME_09586 [Necator americanus]ETN79831.1 hypothetical protein NECAME_09586 [Necator americanus]